MNLHGIQIFYFAHVVRHGVVFWGQRRASELESISGGVLNAFLLLIHSHLDTSQVQFTQQKDSWAAERYRVVTSRFFQPAAAKSLASHHAACVACQVFGNVWDGFVLRLQQCYQSADANIGLAGKPRCWSAVFSCRCDRGKYGILVRSFELWNPQWTWWTRTVCLLTYYIVCCGCSSTRVRTRVHSGWMLLLMTDVSFGPSAGPEISLAADAFLLIEGEVFDIRSKC